MRFIDIRLPEIGVDRQIQHELRRDHKLGVFDADVGQVLGLGLASPNHLTSTRGEKRFHTQGKSLNLRQPLQVSRLRELSETEVPAVRSPVHIFVLSFDLPVKIDAPRQLVAVLESQ